MTFSDDIYTVCSGDSGVTGLVADRIYSTRQPENDYPQIVYTAGIGYDDAVYRDHDGPPGRTEEICQFDCYGSTANEAEDVANTIVALWSGYQNDGLGIGYAFISNKINDGYNSSLDAYRYIVDVLIEHSV